jgi:replicative DNA helicase
MHVPYYLIHHFISEALFLGDSFQPENLKLFTGADIDNPAYRIIWEVMTACFEKYGNCNINLFRDALSQYSETAGNPSVAMMVEEVLQKIINEPDVQDPSDDDTNWKRLFDIKQINHFEYLVRVELPDLLNKHQESEDIKNIDVEAYSNLALSMVDRLNNVFASDSDVTTVSAQMDDVLRTVYDKMEGVTETISTGFKTLDSTIGQLHGEQLIILAGRPGTGKTTFAANIALHVAMNYGPVLFFSQEMEAKDVCQRLVSAHSKVDYSTLYFKNGEMPTSAEVDSLAKATHDMRENASKMFLVEKVQTVQSLISKTKLMHRKLNLQMIVIDYLTLTEVTGRMTSYEKTNIISEALRQLTKELKIPVLCLAQMNRDYEKRVDSKPQNSDLRESGKIEQDAHVIMFLYQKSKAISFKGADEILCGITKNRSGKSGSVPFLFYKDQCRFEEKSYETGMRATFTGISSVSE